MSLLSPVNKENFSGGEKVNRYVRVLTALTILTLASITSVYASAIVWRWTTKITVKEPFEITTTLPTEATLYPGTYSYIITIINHASQDFNATLYYNTTVTNCTIQITPTNGTSYTVKSMNSITIPITITISLAGTNGTAIIDWWIERS